MAADRNRTTSASEKLVDLGFMDARSKLLDVAAFLDRIDRHGGSSDFRVEALRQVLTELGSTDFGRAQRILERLSDQSEQPASKASTQAACGAPPPVNS